MKIRKDIAFKVLAIGLLYIYACFIPITSFSNKIDALAVLVMSGLLLYKGRKNLPLTIMFIFIFYVNYSVVMGEYITAGNLSVPFTEVKTTNIYGLTIRILLMFMTIVSLFYNEYRPSTESLKFKERKNSIIYWLIMIMLMASFFFGVERGGFDAYSVRINPIFEYSKILFLFAFYFSGKSRYKKNLIIMFVIIFILQDVYYGGRITSMQLAIFLSLTIFIEKLSFYKISLFSIIGIIFNSLVNAYRTSFTFVDISIVSIIRNLFSGYFVFDTATYAYYASATHVAASHSATIENRIQSAFEFIKSIFGVSNSPMREVTSFVSREYYFNMGGGFIPTHFYFWFGWTGVILIATILVLIINNLPKKTSSYSKLLLYTVIITAPRWYLYSPSQLFRGALFIVSILYIFSCLGINITSKIRVIQLGKKAGGID